MAETPAAPSNLGDVGENVPQQDAALPTVTIPESEASNGDSTMAATVGGEQPLKGGASRVMESDSEEEEAANVVNSGSEDDEEEEDDDDDDEVGSLNGFVADENEEEESADSDDSGASELDSSSSSDDEREGDEEDAETRKKRKLKRKKLRRKRARDETLEVQDELKELKAKRTRLVRESDVMQGLHKSSDNVAKKSQQEAAVPLKAPHSTAAEGEAEAIGEQEEKVAVEEAMEEALNVTMEGEGEILDEMDEMADFIDDEGLVDEDGEAPQKVTRRRYRTENERRLAATVSLFGEYGEEYVLSDEDDLDEVAGDGAGQEGGDEEEEEVEDVSKDLATLKSVFEPEVLKSRYLTPADHQIQAQDIPERFQLMFPGREKTDVSTLEMEVEWIFAKGFAHLAHIDTTIWRDEIRQFLSFLLVDFYEVPFILQYRREHVSHLTEEHCWKIVDLDRSFMHMQGLRAHTLRILGQCVSTDFHFNNDSLREYVEECPTEEEVTDALAFASNMYAMYKQIQTQKSRENAESAERNESGEEENALTEVAGDNGKSMIELRRIGFLSACKKAKFDKLLSMCHIDLVQFVEHVQRQYASQDDVKDATQSPSEIFVDFFDDSLEEEAEEGSSSITEVCPAVEHVRDVLVRYAAGWIAMEPRVRAAARMYMREQLVVSTEPTDAGKQELDAYHVFAAVRKIRNKPLEAFRGDDFQMVLVHAAEQAGLIEVKISRQNEHEEMCAGIGQFLQSHQEGMISQQWNQLRRDIWKAVMKKLGDEITMELLRVSRKEAEESIGNMAAATLKTQLQRGGMHCKLLGDQPHLDRRQYRYIAVSSTYPMCLVVVNGNGQVLQKMTLKHYHKRRDAIFANERAGSLLEQNRFEAEEDALIRLLASANAFAIGVGVSGEVCRRLHENLVNLVTMGRPTTVVEGWPLPQMPLVEFIDDRVAQRWARCPLALEEFPEMAEDLRFSIGLGRDMVEPLWNLTALAAAHESTALASLPCHLLQSYIPTGDLIMKLERQIIMAVCQAGVDINSILFTAVEAPMLSFVAGLGHRKAAHLIQQIRKTGEILTQADDLVSRYGMGLNNWMNAIGFLKIRQVSTQWQHEVTIDPLLGTRIHPESVDYAIKMAADATNVASSDDRGELRCVEEAFAHPEKLNTLDLVQFANHIRDLEESTVSRLQTFQDIVEEFRAPFRDHRSWSAYAGDELFSLITGETEDSLAPSMIIDVVVAVVKEKFVVCRLDGPIVRGMLFPYDVSTRLNEKRQAGGMDMCEWFHVGQALQAVILEVDKERYSVKLSTKSEDIKNAMRDFKIRFADSFLEPLSLEDNIAASQHQKHYIRRKIDHPLFENITFREACTKLAEAEIGECLVRPSSKGTDFLTITWKFGEQAFVHLEVAEEDKPTLIGLGRRLLVEGEEFEDLDEILSRHVGRQVQNLKDLMRHKYFVVGGPLTTTERVQELKLRDPRLIVYRFCVDEKEAGRGVVIYQPRRTVRREYFTILPDGFRFRRQVFPDLNAMISWFKVHYDDPLPQTMALPSAPPPVSDGGAFFYGMDRLPTFEMGGGAQDYHQQQQQQYYETASSVTGSYGGAPPGNYRGADDADSVRWSDQQSVYSGTTATWSNVPAMPPTYQDTRHLPPLPPPAGAYPPPPIYPPVPYGGGDGNRQDQQGPPGNWGAPPVDGNWGEAPDDRRGPDARQTRRVPPASDGGW